jgi:hypothetical protein
MLKNVYIWRKGLQACLQCQGFSLGNWEKALAFLKLGNLCAIIVYFGKTKFLKRWVLVNKFE